MTQEVETKELSREELIEAQYTLLGTAIQQYHESIPDMEPTDSILSALKVLGMSWGDMGVSRQRELLGIEVGTIASMHDEVMRELRALESVLNADYLAVVGKIPAQRTPQEKTRARAPDMTDEELRLWQVEEDAGTWYFVSPTTGKQRETKYKSNLLRSVQQWREKGSPVAIPA